MAERIRRAWEYLQDLADINGDCIMALMSLVFIWRVAMTYFGHPGLNVSEATFYGSAIAAFSYSNVNKK